MTNFVLFQGGSGSMTAKAFAHLVAIGMVKSGEWVHMQLCDKDATNKDTEESGKIIDRVKGLSSSDFLNPADGNGICDNKTCFTTKVERDSFDFSQVLINISREKGAGDDPNLPLRECVKDDSYADNADQLLLDAFFTEYQQDEPITVGFKGSASRGATIYSYLLEKNQSIIEPIMNYLSNNKTEHCRVFIVGSIFGGTGASMFLKTAEIIKKMGKERVHVAGALILPSFRFKAKDGCGINPDKFWGKTMTSLKGYADYPNLVKAFPEDKDGLFDRLYLAVQPNNELHYCTIGVSEGGSDQSRKSDFIDIVTANYIADFINAAPTGKSLCYAQGDSDRPVSNIYTLKYPDVNAETPLTFNCIPGLEENVVRMLNFSAVVFWLKWSLRNEERLHHVDWLKGLFGRRTVRRNAAEIGPVVDNVLDPIFEYCKEYVDFIKAISENGEPTKPDCEDYSKNYRFFNKVNVDALWKVKDSMSDGHQMCSQGKIAEVLNCNNYCGEDFTKTAMDALQNAVGKKQLKENTSYKDGVSAYINLMFDYLK